MGNSNHVHKYKKVLLSERTGARVFKCQVPGCSRHIARKLVVGEISECWKCGETLILTMENTRLTRPTHPDCRGRRLDNIVIPNDLIPVRKEKVSIDDAIDTFMKDLGI